MENKINYRETLKLLGLRIQLFRKQKHLTQEEMAFKINKSKDTVSNIERGLAFARIETLIDICNVLEIELKDLFGYPMSNDTTKKKVNLIDEISKILASSDTEKLEKYLEMIRLIG